MNTTDHYDVRRFHLGALHGQVRSLACLHCPLLVDVPSLHRRGDKSGQGRYNRARAKMVAHLHAEHRAALATPPDVGLAP